MTSSSPRRQTAAGHSLPLTGELLGRLAAVVDDAPERIPCTNACLHLISGDHRRIVCQAVSRGYRATRLAYGLDLTDCPGINQMIATRDIVPVTDALASDLVAKVAVDQYGLRAALYTPVFSSAGDVVAVLVFSYQHPHEWTSDQFAQARGVSQAVGDLLSPLNRMVPAPPGESTPEAQRLRAILDTVPGVAAAVGPDLIAYDAGLGGSAAGARFTSVAQLLQDLNRGADLQRAIRDTCAGDLGQFEAVIESAEAMWRVNVRPILTPAGIEGAAVVCTDLSEVLRAKAILDASRHMEALGRIASTVAHEFNNLLQIIAGALDQLRATDADDAAFQEQVIRDSVERGSKLSRQLLTYARAQPPNIELYHLSQVVTESWPILQNAVGKDRSLALLMRDDVTIQVDRDQLSIALLNLCINARDATRPGGEIVVKLERERDAGATYGCITVSDTGTGMSPEVLRRATEPFFTTKPRGQGTGLGLPTAQSVVEAQGGRFRISSELGKGTSVSMLFPTSLKRRATPPAGLPAVGPIPSPSPLERPARVLVIDDEEFVAKWAAIVLNQSGYEVRVAASLSEAREVFEAEPAWPDVVLLDMTLPDGSGLTFYREARGARPDLRFLVCSGFADSADIRAITADGHELLTKPVTRAVLCERMRRAAGG